MSSHIAASHFDVLIVGAGPAGCSAALTLLNHTTLKVGVIESSDLQRTAVGESVSSSMLNLLEYLQLPKTLFQGATEANSSPCLIPTHGSTAFWGSDNATGRDSIFSPDASTYQLDRESFDLILLEQAMERGAEILPRSKITDLQFSDSSHHNPHWQCQCQHDTHGAFNLSAEFIIDASGRNSVLSTKAGATRNSIDKLTGVGTFLTRNSAINWPSEQIIESTELGWWYAAALPNNRVVVTFFSDADILSSHRLNRPAQWRQLLNESRHLSHILGVHVPHDVQLWVRKANSSITHTESVPQFYAVGDAVCSFDPISSMGLGFAMTCASQAAVLISRALTQSKREPYLQALTHYKIQYQQDIQRNFDDYLSLREHFYQQEQRWFDSPFWQRRQTSPATPLSRQLSTQKNNARTEADRAKHQVEQRKKQQPENTTAIG